MAISSIITAKSCHFMRARQAVLTLVKVLANAPIVKVLSRC